MEAKIDLNQFPPDIWASIVWYVSGEQLGRLKMTGATLLWRKLSAHGVVRSVNLGTEYIQFKSWPAFLNEFPSLEDLSIDTYRNKYSQLKLLKVSSLPPTLRKLRIEGDSFMGDEDEVAALSQHLPHLESLDTSWLNNDLGTDSLPDRLTYLSIHSWDGKTTLPSSLLHFKSYSINLSPTLKTLQLPSGLETLRTQRLSGLALLVRFCPPSFCGLSFSQAGVLPSTFNFDQFPNSLRSLSIPALGRFRLTPELVSLLPRALTELILQDYYLPPEAWRALPSSLTKLTCPNPKLIPLPSTSAPSDQRVQPFPLETLPKSLTHLDFIKWEKVVCLPPGFETFEEISKSYFPPRLTLLRAPEMQLTPTIAKLLPSSLTDLEIASLCELICENLPRRLRRLKVDKVLMSPNIFKFLPRTLIELDLACASKYDDRFDYCTGELVKYDSLPEFAIDEEAMNKCWHDLPPSLTHLTVYYFENMGDEFVTNLKLPNLLHLIGCQSVTDHAIKFLNPHLTMIDFGVSKITGKCFPLLPRGLLYLYMDSACDIFDSDIQHLPRTLKELEMNGAVDLTESCIVDLPRHLTLLSIYRNDKITPSCFEALPYSLRSSQNEFSADFAKWNIGCGRIHEKWEGNCYIATPIPGGRRTY